MRKIIMIANLFIVFNAFAKDFVITPKTEKLINITDEKFLSFGLDTAQIVGSYWWDKEGKMIGGRGKNKVSPLDLKNKILLKHVSALAPAYLRIGGSEADALYYNMKDNSDKRPEKYDSTLTKKKWKEIESFIKNTNTELFFTLNQGPSSWDSKGKWDTTNLREFLKFLSKEGAIPYKFELGNEVFAYWAIFGLSYQLSEEDYAKNFLETKNLLKQNNLNAKLAGPASAFWPIIGEPLGFIFNEMEDLFPILKNDYDIITWHYYPTQSFRCPVAIRRMNKERLIDLDVLNEIKKWAKVLVKDKNKYSPKAELWLGETGSAQCGGEPKISDQFISSIWWIDQLGILAKLDHKVVIRHNLIGADYALLNQDGTPRPDYYASYLWKVNMGTKVLSAESTNKNIRSYLHCSPDEKYLSLVLINIANKELQGQIKGIPVTSIKTMEGLDLYQQDVLVNNGKIQNLENLKEVTWNKGDSLTLPKHSISFLNWKDKSGICKKKL